MATFLRQMQGDCRMKASEVEEVTCTRKTHIYDRFTVAARTLVDKNSSQTSNRSPNLNLILTRTLKPHLNPQPDRQERSSQCRNVHILHTCQHAHIHKQTHTHTHTHSHTHRCSSVLAPLLPTLPQKRASPLHRVM